MGGTPWHAHHIAERYGLLTIIALGEGVVGTVASLSAVVGAQGWTCGRGPRRGGGHRAHLRHVVDVLHRAAVAELLHAHRERSFRFGYLHLVVFGAIVATGAGLHAAAYYIEHHSKLGSVEHGAVGGDAGRGLHRGGLSALRVVGAHAWTRSTCCFSR